MVKLIEIQVPIWSSKSVGVNIADTNPDDLIHIDIVYKNKQGIKIYPNVYEIIASEAYKYPQQKLRGAIVHIIPINQLKPISMAKSNKGSFISSDSLDKTRQDLNNNKKVITGGAHELKLKSVELKQSKSGADMIVVEFEKSEEYYTLKTYLTFSQAAMEISTKKAVEIIEKGYGAKMQPCDAISDLEAQLKQFLNKPLLWAVRMKARVYDTEKHGTVVGDSPELWYCGSVASRDTFRVDPTKISVAMSEADMKRYNDITQLTGVPPKRLNSAASDAEQKTTEAIISTTSQTTAPALPPAPVVNMQPLEDDGDDLPF